ncbi:PaaI family thioesterase [Rothia terrae]|uniref:Hotdog fold thioesterase n=1 Tax=Rothia terrae TaxID=396015 RepID=A0A7H2BBE3_9MICC|nr:hotdog fold thioesterase [Rothia terrae]MDT0188691.1 hotdog fold thioesterase [Rothia terrae]QNV36989.1 hotdog fold thioesterase [Rothia terrae]
MNALPNSPASDATNFTYGGLIEKLGIEFSEISAERAVATMPVVGNTQPYGLLHGGASAALAESLGSMAANAYAPEGQAAAGVDLNITHLRPTFSGIVTGICTAVRLGKTMCVHTVEIFDANKKMVATARITNAIVNVPSRP